VTDPKFGTNAQRLENRDELVALIEAWLQSFPSNDAALQTLAEARIPCAPILDVGQAFQHPHIRARGMITEVEHPVFGRMEITNTPFVFSETPREVQGPAPLIGQHNATILRTHLGYSAAEIARLTADGVLVEEEQVKALAAQA
jgi:formyl-CoA transferase